MKTTRFFSILLALATVFSVLSVGALPAQAAESKTIFNGKYIESVFQNKSQTIAVVKTSGDYEPFSAYYYYTTNGMDYTQVNLNGYISGNEDEISVDVNVVKDTFFICIEMYQETADGSDWKVSYVLLKSTDFKSFQKCSAPNEMLTDVQMLDNGTYIFCSPDFYYYTSTDLKNYKKHELPNIFFKHDYIDYVSAGNVLLVEGHSFSETAFNGAITAIYATSDFNNYRNISPSSNVNYNAISYAFDSDYKTFILAVSTQFVDADRNHYIYKLSKIDIATGKETVLKSDDEIVSSKHMDTLHDWTWIHLNDHFVYFYNVNEKNETYIYQYSTGSFGKGVCAYKELYPCDNLAHFLDLDDEHTFCVSGERNILFMFNPTRLDQCKTFDLTAYGYKTEDEYSAPTYYVYAIGGNVYLLATDWHKQRNKLTKLDFDFSWGAEKPAPGVTLSNVASSGKIKVAWNDIGAEKYEVYRAASKSGAYKLMKTTTSLSYVNTSATAGKTYYYKVRGVFSDGTKSAFSAIKSRTCDLARPVVTASNVAASGSVKLTWKAIDGAVKYKVYRATSENGTYKLMKTTTSLSYVNSSVTAGKKYYYKVKAIAENSAADSAYSTVKSRTAKLARPTASVSLNSAGKPVVKWGKVNGAVSYKVYRSTSASGSYTLMKTTTSLSYTNTGAEKGKTYYYKVKAICSNTDGNSAYSSVVSMHT